MREGLILEVADGQLDDGVLAVLGLDDGERVGPVGRERKSSQLGSSSPCWFSVRTRRTTRRRSPNVVSAIWAMLVGG